MHVRRRAGRGPVAPELAASDPDARELAAQDRPIAEGLLRIPGLVWDEARTLDDSIVLE
jgi:hypothetical protein